MNSLLPVPFILAAIKALGRVNQYLFDGDNSYGALSYGVAWKVSPNVGVIFGMDKYNNDNYKPTYTFQVDIDI